MYFVQMSIYFNLYFIYFRIEAILYEMLFFKLTQKSLFSFFIAEW